MRDTTGVPGVDATVKLVATTTFDCKSLMLLDDKAYYSSMGGQ